tara:strand:+ start:728 stop:919 length:192 start_codon:yes stop_codon:yes gene_type:complete
MTDIVEILSDLDGPITDEDRVEAAKEILRLKQENRKLSCENFKLEMEKTGFKRLLEKLGVEWQ